MTLAQYHDSLAEYPSVDIILANERLKENVTIHYQSVYTARLKASIFFDKKIFSSQTIRQVEMLYYNLMDKCAYCHTLGILQERYILYTATRSPFP